MSEYLNDVARRMNDIAHMRERNGGSVKTDVNSMLKHCATEVIEAQHAYDRCGVALSIQEYDDNRTRFADELADIIACVLIISAESNVDIEKYVNRCVDRNEKRARRKGDKL